MTHDELVQLNVDIAAWEQARDAASVKRLDHCLSPALIFRRADGSAVGKDAFLAGLAGPSPFTRRESRDVVVTRIGDRAMVTLLVITDKPDGTVGRYRNVRVFFRGADGWRLEVWINDAVTDPPTRIYETAVLAPRTSAV